MRGERDIGERSKGKTREGANDPVTEGDMASHRYEPKIYRVDRILPQICTASAKGNMKHALKQMQYRFSVIYETLSSISISV